MGANSGDVLSVMMKNCAMTAAVKPADDSSDGVMTVMVVTDDAAWWRRDRGDNANWNTWNTPHRRQ